MADIYTRVYGTGVYLHDAGYLASEELVKVVWIRIHGTHIRAEEGLGGGNACPVPEREDLTMIRKAGLAVLEVREGCTLHAPAFYHKRSAPSSPNHYYWGFETIRAPY
jgi:hypothetical protein